MPQSKRDKTLLLLDAYPLSLGAVGISTYTRQLIQALSKTDFASKTTLLIPHWMANDPSVLTSGMRVKKIFLPRKLPGLLRNWLWMEIAGLLSIWYRRAVFHSPSLFSSVFSSPRTFVTCHDLIPLRFPKYLGTKFVRAIQFKKNLEFLERCRGILTVSEFSRVEIMAATGIAKTKIHVVPNMLSNRFNPTQATRDGENVRCQYGLPSRFWLYIGGYDYRKNVEFLIHAYAHIRAYQPDCPKLVLAGHLPKVEHETLCDIPRALSQSKLNSSAVIFPGYIAETDLPGLYGAAELLIFPSLAEGFGLTPLEAMMCGCPAVCADNTSLREVVPDGSRRFSTESAHGLVEILRLATLHPFSRDFPFNRDQYLAESIVPLYLEALGLRK